MNKIPRHIAIILDGNRRWAKERNLPSIKGHQKGAQNMIDLGPKILDLGVEYLSVFAFSTENFNRTKEEVDYLMNLFVKEFKKLGKELNKYNVKVVFSGGIHPLNAEVLKVMEDTTELTKNNTKGTLNICLNYGGKSEIIRATKKIINKINNYELKIEELNEKVFEENLDQNLPSIDLLIRTSGEKRLSNFMLWQLSYAELYFTNTHFPALNINEVKEIIDDYSNRERRFGGNK